MKDVVAINNEQLLSLVKEQIDSIDISIRVKGRSMRPFFIDGVTIATLTKYENIKKFDVVLFEYNNKYFLHRVVKIKNDSIVTQGDGLISKEHIKEENIIAKVKFFEHHRKLTLATDKKYLFKVKLWYLFRPIRRLLLKVVK